MKKNMKNMKNMINNIFNLLKSLFQFVCMVLSRLALSIQEKINNITFNINKFIIKILYSFTAAKVLSAIITCIIAALCKYFYSGSFYIE